MNRYDLTGAFLDDFIRLRQAILDTPVGLAFFDDDWFVACGSMGKVLKFDRNGQLLDADFIAAGSDGIDGPTFLAMIVREPSAHIIFPVLLSATVIKDPTARSINLSR